MSNDDDNLAHYDLSAWEVPPPPADLADSVIDRMGGTDVGIAIPVETREPRRAWIIAGVAVAVIALVLGMWTLVRSSRPAAPTTGGVIADRARVLSLDTVHATMDPGAEVRWKREGDVLFVEQRAGRVTWHVDSGEKLVIDAGAKLASVEATGANLRVEVLMNATDARVIGASALTAAAVAMVTVVVYDGHVKAGRGGGQTNVLVAPGATHEIKADEQPTLPSDPPVVGSAPVRTTRGKVAVLGLEVVGNSVGDENVVAHLFSKHMRFTAETQGPYVLAPHTDKELVDEKILGNCASEAAQCMATIGANLGVDKLIYGGIERKQDGYVINVKLLDVANKKLERSSQLVMPIADAGSYQWGERAYLTLVDTTVTTAPATCDADALKEEAMQAINMGQHAAALAKLEASLDCKRDQYVIQLAFMESCASRNEARAKHYYKLLTSAQQAKFAQLCIRQNVEYQSDEPVPVKLSASEISGVLAKVTPAILAACSQHATAGGQLDATVEVNARGTVTDVTIASSPNEAVAKCVKPHLEKLRFSETLKGSTFSVPMKFSAKATAPANCDADALKEEAMQNINMGQHAAALSRLEASLRCKRDQYVIQLCFMESCASRNSPKAKYYYKLLTPDQQAKFAQMCEREQVEYENRGSPVDVFRDNGGPKGYLKAFTKPTAKVLIDGVDTGLETPIAGNALALTPGKHKITFIIGDDRFTYPVIIKAGETASVSKDLQ